MTSLTKPFATLSSGLLARKGAARPAMRPQGFGHAGTSLDDLGWNDLGYEPPRPAVVAVRDSNHDAFGESVPEPPLRHPLAALTPANSPVHEQQTEIAERFAGNDRIIVTEEEEQEEEPVESRWQAPALTLAEPVVLPGRSDKKIAFTLRLEPTRHLKLRLACAVSGRSAQQLLTTALDELFASMPGLDSLAEHAPGARTSRKG